MLREILSVERECVCVCVCMRKFSTQHIFVAETSNETLNLYQPTTNDIHVHVCREADLRDEAEQPVEESLQHSGF